MLETPEPMAIIPDKEKWFLRAIEELDSIARKEEVSIWIYGGLAVEAYDGGRITREHDNLNIAVEEDDMPLVEDVLMDMGMMVEVKEETFGSKQKEIKFTNIEAHMKPEREVYAIGLRPIKVGGNITGYSFHEPKYFANIVRISENHFSEEYRVTLEGVEFSTLSPEVIYITKRLGTFDAHYMEIEGKDHVHHMDLERMKAYVNNKKIEEVEASILIR